jgi:hypothetical protein
MRMIATLVAWPLLGQVSFLDTVWPVLEKAGCKNCHGPEGVASPTRLHFPEAEADRARQAAFGESLGRFIDRADPTKSLLLLKPTNRVSHGGGERIAPGSPEESAIKAWISHLAASRASAPADVPPPPPPAPTLRRLSHDQYANTVRDLLREPSDIASRFPPEDYVDGFRNQFRSQQLSPALIEAYAASAEKLAANAFRRGDSRQLIPCDYQGRAASACRSKFIAVFGRRAFRRPLTTAETARYESLFRAEPDFLKGAQGVVEAMLQSPAFLFWMDGAPKPEWRAYAAASRLSYFLWNTMPDDTLLDSAAAGDLDTVAGVERAARRMLDHPRAKQALDEFVSQWLRFDRAFAAARERRTFPQFSRDFVQSAAEEAKRFVGHLAWNDLNFMDLFRASYGFVNSDLAVVYQVPAPPRDFDRVEFPAAQQRPGVLGQALFLTLTSKPEDTAPTGRGLFVREQFLCQHVPPPPPGAAGNLPVLSEARPVTNRERLAEHTTNKSCASCHRLIDPIGFAFENFDAIGMRRDKFRILFYPDEHEAKKPSKEVLLDLDTTGEITGVPGSRFNGSRELGETLARTEQCQQCVVKQVFRYMNGRMNTRGDEPAIRRSWEEFRDSGFRFKELLLSLIRARETTYGQRNHQAR